MPLAFLRKTVFWVGHVSITDLRSHVEAEMKRLRGKIRHLGQALSNRTLSPHLVQSDLSSEERRWR